MAAGAVSADEQPDEAVIKATEAWNGSFTLVTGEPDFAGYGW